MQEEKLEQLRKVFRKILKDRGIWNEAIIEELVYEVKIRINNK